MVRSWFRGLARKCSPGSQFPSSVPPRRRPRTLLRLEEVEDRTVASSVQDEPPTSVPPAHEASIAAASPPKTGSPKDEPGLVADGGAANPGSQQQESLTPVVGDAPVLMADGVPPASTANAAFSDSADLHPGLRLQTAADEARSDEIVPRPARPPQSLAAETAAPTDANGVS